MAADLHIHVLVPPATQQDVIWEKRHTLGSKYSDFAALSQAYSEDREPTPEERAEHARRQADMGPKWGTPEYKAWQDRYSNTPNIWIGEVSWLKAALTEDTEKYIPDLCERVVEIVGEDFRLIDDAFLAEIAAAFDTCTNRTQYDLARKSEVMAFLEQYRGYPVFDISW